MPLAEEKLAEKTPFDVYAVMLVLTALLTVGATLLLHNDLVNNWFGGELPGAGKHPVHLTKLNAQTDEEKTGNGESPWTQVTKEDREDYKTMTEQELKTVEYPAWLKVNTTGVKYIEMLNEGLPPDMVPPEEREAMKAGYVESDPTTGVSIEEKAAQ